VGAKINGVDWSTQIDESTRKDVLDAFHKYCVLCFPDQNISDDDQRRFANVFGKADAKLRRPSHTSNAAPQSSLMLITNIRENGQPIGHLPDGEMHFHADGAHREVPYRATTLFAIKVSSRGGETLFANLQKAYDALPESMQRRLEGLKTEVGYEYDTTTREAHAEKGYNRPPAIHSLVKTHPVSGRKSLFLGRLMTRKVIGLDPAESEALLAELFDHAEKPEFVYAHRWTPGDLLIWDNRAVNHARADFPREEIRLLRRCAVDEPN
jgi:taurine dioxygenase